MRQIKANEATAAKRYVYFHCVDATDGMTPETGEADGQPQISTDGAGWTDTGIGTLVAIGNGRYYAALTQAAVATAGQIIESRYKSAETAETPGDTAQVVGYDPASALSTHAATDVIAALMADTGFSADGTLTFATITRADDGKTVVLE